MQQSVQVIRDAAVLEQQDILSRTLHAAAREQELLRETFGGAFALGIAALEVGPETPQCVRIMARPVERSSDYIFAGLFTPDGVLRCSNDGSVIDFSGSDIWRNLAASPRVMINIIREGPITGQSVIVSTVPIFDNVTEEFFGRRVNLGAAHRCRQPSNGR